MKKQKFPVDDQGVCKWCKPKEPAMDDVIGAKELELVISHDEGVIWVNIDGDCRLRVCQIDHLSVRDLRSAEPVDARPELYTKFCADAHALLTKCEVPETVNDVGANRTMTLFERIEVALIISQSRLQRLEADGKDDPIILEQRAIKMEATLRDLREIFESPLKTTIEYAKLRAKITAVLNEPSHDYADGDN